MPRAFYESTIGKPDTLGVWSVLTDIKVTVYPRGSTTTPVTIYQRETGAAQGPSPEAGAVGATNPFNTGPSGGVQFWVDAPARYDIKLEDNVVPARIATRTVQWNAIPIDEIPGANVIGVPAVYASGVPGVSVVAGSLTIDKLAATALDYLCPIGTLLDYGGVSDPPLAGSTNVWLVADGRSLAISSYPTLAGLLGTTWNTFDGQAAPGGTNFRIPKTGARVAIPTGVSAGITTRSRGQFSGSEALNMPSHAHTTVAAGSHSHGGATVLVSPGGPWSHGHTVQPDTALYNTAYGAAGVPVVAGGANYALPRQTLGTDGADLNHSHGITADGSHGHTINASGGGAGLDNLPPWVCLGAKIIRVL